MRPAVYETNRARSGEDSTARDLQYSKFPRFCPHPLATTSLSGRTRSGVETTDHEMGSMVFPPGLVTTPT